MGGKNCSVLRYLWTRTIASALIMHMCLLAVRLSGAPTLISVWLQLT